MVYPGNVSISVEVADDTTTVRCGLRRGLGDVCAQRLTMAHRRRVSAGRGEKTRYTMVCVLLVSSILRLHRQPQGALSQGA
jgi:hypothetical protein